MAGTSDNHESLQRIYYGKKDWFVVVCGLNGSGLVPGLSLSEIHISKQQCIDVFGDQKANNGYKVGRTSKYRDRVLWLWKRVHQADKPPNNDIGLRFCQGLLYEERHGHNSVDWAQFAVQTVGWFQHTRGLCKVHKDWASAYPFITIDVNTGKRVCPAHPTKTIEKRPIHAKRVKVEYVPVNDETPLSEIPISPPTPQDSAPIQRNQCSKHPSNSKIPSKKASIRFEEEPVKCTPEIPNVQTPSPKASSDSEGMPHGCTQNPEIPSATARTGDSKGKTCGCAVPILNALQSVRVDIERAISVQIKELEEQKTRLKSVLDHNRNDVEVASATIKMLKENLEGAKKSLSSNDTNESHGEVIWIESALKSGEKKLNSQKANYEVVLKQWRSLLKLLTEKHQAQKTLETYFHLKDEEDQAFVLG